MLRTQEQNKMSVLLCSGGTEESSLFRKVDDKKVYQYIYQCMIRLVVINARRDKASKGWIVMLGAKEDG